jgi:hypothetical protein
MLHRLVALLLILTFSGPAFAAAEEVPTGPRISLITVSPGDAAYSMFGHSAVRVVDEERDIDWLFNYGTFNFGDPLFIPKFAYGQMDYMLSVDYFYRSFHSYSAFERRSVVEQELNLTPDQREAMLAFLQQNAMPENRVYRYDFLFDNCSTRPRDVLQVILGPDLRFDDVHDPERTFRQLIEQYAARMPWLHLGMDVLLGARVDRQATSTEVMFLPDYLFEAFEHAEVRIDGAWQPLVSRTDTLYAAPPLPAGGLGPWPWMWALLALGGALTFAEVLRKQRYRAGVAFDTALYLVVGLFGLLMFVMWFFTLHDVTAWNMNLLWAWPTHAFVAFALARNRRYDWLPRYFLVSAILSVILVFGWPIWPQELPMPVLPIILLVGARSAGQAYRFYILDRVHSGERPAADLASQAR